ncbi:TM2 domain-containing protein [Chryseobacterium sp.]|uniref:TM2 domain-containing protein n=1 Tax=Chryseobacterium sp. TaxID=1871047 RepID=UPI0025C6FC58|nr:TM2 domain-containing protein [Chryseobacterium sp.]MBV8327184.1 TM2 domain-containing protein [Chryseobacterium sp.]
MKSKFTAVILALFLGGLGIHRFYLGQNIKGILYLVFCWTFIPSLIAFCDFLAFIIMSEERFNYKYNLQSGL